MLAEKIIFNVFAFSLFVLIFFKMIRRNDSNYVVVLCLEAIRNSNKFYRNHFSFRDTYIYKNYNIFVINNYINNYYLYRT